MKFVTLIALYVALNICNAEIFTALATMKRALYIEKKLAEQLRSYAPLIADKVASEQVAKIAEDYDRIADESLVEPEGYLANPVNAYMLCKRFTTELVDLKQLLTSPALKAAFDDQLYIYRTEMPDREDFTGVIDALLRLQDTYEIPPLHFVDGTFSPAGNSPRMTASDCFEIGKYAYDKGDKYHALMWLLESLSSYELEGASYSMDKILLLDYLIYAADDQGNPRHALNYANDLLALNPTNERTRSRIQDVIRWLHSEIATENKTLLEQNRKIPSQTHLPPIQNKRTLKRAATQEFLNYEALCRGEDLKPNPNEHKLTCFYSSANRDPLLVLAPAKVEVLYEEPLVWIFHDVISDNEIGVVKGLATPLLKRAVVNDPKTGKLVTAQYRVSRSSWLYDVDHPIVATLSKRISAMGNVDLETAEPLQVVNYGIGGQYEPHFDHSRENDPKVFKPGQGNRIATWMFYLSDVPAGGYTVFTEIGVRIPPIKGAAAFWLNLHKNGRGNALTRHAGCPVLSGSKWVANKWIHVVGQEKRRPCSLDENK
ncbi:prolyl 4-hydroxylase subunit alpha-1-like [Watersipora subatra]|uniref:prolyl 4-hydroxylase subunit alpha-1-like n=1 Tax=Watersipora subatra TaxID=2589382 RepID=UPI00355BCFCD